MGSAAKSHAHAELEGDLRKRCNMYGFSPTWICRGFICLSLSRSLTHIDVVVAAAVQHHSCREHGLARHYEDTDDNHELIARYNQSNIGTLSNG